MTTPTHPQRCDTCDKCDKSGPWWYCNESDISINPLYCIELIEQVGCSSHSSVQSHDQMLDELNNWLQVQQSEAMIGIDSEDDFTKEWEIRAKIFNEIMDKIVELRTQGSRDPDAD